MAKKGKGKKGKAPARGARARVEKAAAKLKRTVAKEPAKGPRSQVLPGFRQVRDQKLDNLCEDFVEQRSTKNAAATKEADITAAALQRMQLKGIPLYRHAGAEFLRTPGAEKLRARLTKEEGDADAGDLVEPTKEDVHDEGAGDAPGAPDGGELADDETPF